MFHPHLFHSDFVQPSRVRVLMSAHSNHSFAMNHSSSSRCSHFRLDLPTLFGFARFLHFPLTIPYISREQYLVSTKSWNFDQFFCFYLLCLFWFVVVVSIVLLDKELSLWCSFDERLSDFELLRASFPSFTVFSSFVSLLSLTLSLVSFNFFDGPRRRGGGAFDVQHWQYHLPRGTLINGGM